jgi:hypothetical protein
MAQQATQAELNRFVQVVDEFKAKLARLKAPATRAKVYRSGDAKLISDYETAVVRGNALNNSIAALVGAWAAFKRGYARVTDTTSTVIGDAIDEIRSWFGYDPAPGIGEFSPQGAYRPYDSWAGGYGTPYSALAGLGAVQIGAPIAAVAVAGVISAAMLLNSLMNKIFIRIEATAIQESDPTISRGAALAQAEAGITGPGLFGGGVTPVMLGVGALALWLIFSQKK